MAEDFDNHRRIFDGAAMIFSAKTQKVIELAIESVCLSLKFADVENFQKTHHGGQQRTQNTEKRPRERLFLKYREPLSPLCELCALLW